MTFFYDLNKRLADLAKKQDLNEGAKNNLSELSPETLASYSQKRAAQKADDFSPATKRKDIMTHISNVMKPHERATGEPALKILGKKPAPGMEEASTGDYSAKKARAGKDIGKPGKMFSKIAKSAGERYGSKERGEKVAGAVLAKLRAKEAIDPSLEEADLDEVGRGEWIKQQDAKAEKSGKGKFKAFGQTFDTDEIDEKKEPRSKGTAFDPEVAKSMFSGEKGKTKTGHEVKDTGYSKRYTKQLSDEPDADDEVSDKPKTKGRPKGSKRAIGAKGPTGKSKLMKKDAIKEEDGIPLVDKGEYDREGEMAKQQMHTIMRAAKRLHSMLGDDENLPEWVQKKITLAANYIDGVADYMASKKAEAGTEEPIAEKAVSQQQQKFMGMVHAMQKGEKIPGASPELKKVAREMPKKAAKDYAATKHAGLPKKVKEEGKPDFLDLDKDGNKTEPMKQAAKQAKGKEEADESAEVKPAKKAGFEFGKGIYESMNNKFKQALTEGMNVSVNMNTGPDGNPTKNITVSADGEDAEALAALLKMAGIGHKEEVCPGCGKSDCGCEEELDENSPDWPTNTETSDDAMQYSGGLNGPKSTGQTTVPVIASQLRRQVSMEESVELERSLFKLYQNYKAR